MTGIGGFKELIRSQSMSKTIWGSYSHILAFKLKTLKQDTKTWNRDVFRKASTNKAAALDQICFKDARERNNSTMEKYGKLAEIEEVLRRQKSKGLWLKEGDENTKKKIHKMTNYRRNYWDKVRVNSVSFSEEADIKDGWLTYQKNNK